MVLLSYSKSSTAQLEIQEVFLPHCKIPAIVKNKLLAICQFPLQVFLINRLIKSLWIHKFSFQVGFENSPTSSELLGRKNLSFSYAIHTWLEEYVEVHQEHHVSSENRFNSDQVRRRKILSNSRQCSSGLNCWILSFGLVVFFITANIFFYQMSHCQ